MSNRTHDGLTEIIDLQSLAAASGGEPPGTEYQEYERRTGCEEQVRNHGEDVVERLRQCHGEFVKQNWKNFKPSFASQ